MNKIPTICIVDDDEEIRSLLSDYLRRNGFSTCTAGNAAEFLEMQRRVPCSLIVMDIMLPGMNGLELFRTLRAESTVPVIFLTALGDITDRIVGLELGADDYLSKPFEPRELLARIRTVLRRTEGGARRDQPETTPLQFAGWLLDRSARHLVAPDGVVVSLSGTEYRLLEIFLQNPQRVLSRDELLERTQGRNAVPYDRSIDVQISRLRTRLRDNGREPQLIKTVRGDGYVLATDVRPQFVRPALPVDAPSCPGSSGMPAFLARLLRRLTPTTLSAQLAGMLIGGILLLHGVATVTVQRVEERQAARSALLEQANSLALSLQLLHSEPFEYKRSLLERLERLDVVHLSLGDAPNPARQAQDERALYLRDRLRKNLNSIETDLDTREMLTEVQRVHVADSMNPTLRRHVPWTHVYESRVSVRLDDGKWLCVVISSDAYDFSPSQASLAMLLLEAGLLILLILVVVHRMVRPLRVLSGKAESFGRNLYTAPLPEDGPTEVREAARAFNKMQERIRAGVGQHERILAAVAHDLRTPLTRIRLRVEGMDPASPLRAKLLGDIDILGGIMANSAELTRGSARDEAAVRMDMNALLDSLVSDRQDMGQDVMLEGHCRQPWTVRPNSLRRCLSNLLDNALRYSARVRIRLLEKADVLQIDVLDDGPGIPPEMLEQVFEPFFRLDEARSPHTGGSGLGLSIARSMACRNGGELSLHNRPEGGLCARLCLYRSAMETESL